MIYTVTLNPSLDYIVSVEHFKLGLTNRTGFEQILPGGKGINVSIVLKNLGIASTALGFTAGFTGDEIIRELENTGISQEFIRLEEGISRINVKLRSIDGTEINGRGPEIKKERLKELTDRLCRVTAGRCIIFVRQHSRIGAGKYLQHDYATVERQRCDDCC